MQQSEADLVAWVPIVSGIQRAAFEQYSIEHQGWIADGYRFEGSGGVLVNVSHEIFPFPHANVTDALFDTQGYYAPLWQASPAPLTAALTLTDLRTHPKLGHLFDEILEIDHPVLSDVIDVSLLLGTSSSFQEPRSVILEPVYAKFGVNQFQNSTQEVVGFVAAVMPWRVYFVDELPTGAGDILVEVKNTCGYEFSYSK
jgi:hypothetical protein